MRDRDGLDYLLVVVVAILVGVHVPPYRIARRETIELAHETGIAALVDVLVDVRVGVVLMAVVGLFILLVVTGSLPMGE
jgi:hypothetical protein